MLPPVAILLVKSIVDKVNSHIKNWIYKISKPQEDLGNFPICPYAATAKFVVKQTSVSDIAPITGVDVAIFVVEDSLSLDDLTQKCEELNNLYPDYIFLDDHKDDKSFINNTQTNNGLYNLIIVQEKNHLLQARKFLHKTDYYSYWAEEFYKKIIEG